MVGDRKEIQIICFEGYKEERLLFAWAVQENFMEEGVCEQVFGIRIKRGYLWVMVKKGLLVKGSIVIKVRRRKRREYSQEGLSCVVRNLGFFEGGGGDKVGRVDWGQIAEGFVVSLSLDFNVILFMIFTQLGFVRISFVIQFSFVNVFYSLARRVRFFGLRLDLFFVIQLGF